MLQGTITQLSASPGDERAFVDVDIQGIFILEPQGFVGDFSELKRGDKIEFFPSGNRRATSARLVQK